ncbi:RimK family alpha-L-glutamate ligase [Streptomyces sp. NPDC002779]|uniref:ATP-grasp domain-containing protein n=1 Tax=Streptomyces sp. NPDC002779 TaxID=3364664 RepID=UPI00367EF02A
MAAHGLERAGLTWRPVRWKDPEVSWGSFRAAIVRSTWDYAQCRDEFLASMRRAAAGCELINPLGVLEWNSEKTYLRDLAQTGCDVVPTLWVDPAVCNSRTALAQAIPQDWTDLVVKPTVGAGGSGAMRTRDRHKASAYAVSAGPMLVQPYMDSVDTEGELSMVYLNGEFSHAVRRGPYLPQETLREGLLLPESADTDWQVTACPADGECRAAAEQVLASIPAPAPLVYARVDLIRDAGGRMRVAELEVTEPFLFLGYAEDAADRLAAALRARLT